ncbi:probable RNA-dependent RNA polymerase 5 [Salvia hispanica]|uniref:probable RNA-dependent RNA polymerase 5 n=1 Tax=Salvia hispanica TaxID=49212 RepID=UPI002009572B|nr:probable RNA-dependent RNA polymerase 5 [Salvia hispanica]
MEAKKQKKEFNGDHVRLPELVELAINKILVEKQLQTPLKSYARKMLREIGEQSSLEILKIVHSSKTVTSFSGFVSKMVKKNHPIQADAILSHYNSSPLGISSPSSASPTIPRNGESMQRTGFQNINRQLSFEDEAMGSQSCIVRDASLLSREHNEKSEPVTISPQLLILNKLEYRKLFLLLSYTKGKKLEDLLSIEDSNKVYTNNSLPMIAFEHYIWNFLGSKYCEKSERIQHLDWDSGKTHIYNCHVDPDGNYYFKGPYLNSSRNHLQRSLGDDNVLTVKFLENADYPARKIVEEGLFVGLRRYRFFVFKDELRKKKNKVGRDKESTYSDVKCYFVHFDSISSHDHEEDYILFRKSVSEARGLFMHVHKLPTIEKYMARLSLILSKTTKIDLDFAAIIVEIIEDIPFQDENGSIIHDEDGKPILHTDGTGYISEDLAMKCSKDLHASMHNTDISVEPLLIQCRLFHDGFAVKGTLLLNRKLEPGRIQIRPSMIKVPKDEALESEEIFTFNSLEINTISHRPNRSYLSKYLIALLSYGGVPQEFFLNLLNKALEETRNVFSNRRAALRVASLHDDWALGFIAQRMICSAVPLDEPFLQHCLVTLESSERTKLKEGRIPVNESFYLMGTADPTGVLHNDQVCVILDSGQISGNVLVYRNPGMHFGDIHVMKAVYIEELEEFVGNAKYGIFFSTKGQRSAAYEMATGDFDGDMYWVSRNPELLKFFKVSEPWSRVYPAPHAEKKDLHQYSSLQLEHELFQLFLDSRTPSHTMGIAADSWLTYMDRLLSLGVDRTTEKNSLKAKMLKLIDIYYDAIDAPKSGKKINLPDYLKAELFPHHMGRVFENSYHSSSILGLIYDRVQEFQNADVPGKEIWKMPCFDIPIPEDYLIKWRDRYKCYCGEMANALSRDDEVKNDAADDVIKKYKQLLYDAPEMEESAKDTTVLYEESLAIYHVTYDMVESVEKCGFAWKVAGSALCSLYAWKSVAHKEKPLMMSPSVLRELLK